MCGTSAGGDHPGDLYVRRGVARGFLRFDALDTFEEVDSGVIFLLICDHQLEFGVLHGVAKGISSGGLLGVGRRRCGNKNKCNKKNYIQAHRGERLRVGNSASIRSMVKLLHDGGAEILRSGNGLWDSHVSEFPRWGMANLKACGPDGNRPVMPRALSLD